MAARDQKSFSLHIIQTERDGPKRRREKWEKKGNLIVDTRKNDRNASDSVDGSMIRQGISFFAGLSDVIYTIRLDDIGRLFSIQRRD